MCGMKPTLSLASALAAVAIASLSAQSQGVTFVLSETRDGKVTTTLTQMDRSHIRTETGSGVFIFDGDAQVARIVNMERKSYTEMSKADMQKMSQQMSAAMDKLKDLPPAQRAMAEKMMAGRGMSGRGPAAAPIAYKAAGADKAGQWACTKYDGTRGSEKVLELCTVEPGALGLTPADFEAARQLAEFMKSLMPQMADQIATVGTPAEQGFAGYPIRRSHFSNGKVTSVSELKEIKREAIPASAWQAPAGFKRENPGR
jgi:hypothetical protein